MGRYRVAFGTSYAALDTVRRDPYGYVDETLRHNLFSSTYVVTSHYACLDKRVPHPGRLRTAEGRRRARDLKLLVEANDLHTRYYLLPYDPYYYTLPTT